MSKKKKNFKCYKTDAGWNPLTKIAVIGIYNLINGEKYTRNIFCETSHIAEVEAIEEAIKNARLDANVGRILICNDSLGAVEKMQKKYSTFPSIQINFIPREYNHIADCLTKDKAPNEDDYKTRIDNIEKELERIKALDLETQIKNINKLNNLSSIFQERLDMFNKSFKQIKTKGDKKVKKQKNNMLERILVQIENYEKNGKLPMSFSAFGAFTHPKLKVKEAKEILKPFVELNLRKQIIGLNSFGKEKIVNEL